MTAALLALSFTVQAGEIIDNVSIPFAFSPNDDGKLDTLEISFSLTREADKAAVIISLLDDPGDTVRMYHFPSPGQETITVSWEGEDSTGVAAQDAFYRIVINATDGEIEDVESTNIVLDTRYPEIVYFTIYPNPFSFTGMEGDTLFAEFGIHAEPEDTLTTIYSGIEIYDSETGFIDYMRCYTDPEHEYYKHKGQATLQTFWAPGSDTIAFERDEYLTFFLKSEDDAQNAASNNRSVLLDIYPPDLHLLTGDSLTRFNADTLTLSGWAQDLSGVNLLWVSTDDGLHWGEVAPDRVAADSLFWTYNFSGAPGSPLEEKEYIFSFRAMDNLNHMNTSDGPFPILTRVAEYDTTPPILISTQPDTGDTLYPDYENGDEIRLLTTWDDAGYAITADFSVVDTNFDPGDVSMSDNGDGSYSVRYAVSGNNANPDGEGLIVPLTAFDGVNAPTADSSCTVNLINHTPRWIAVYPDPSDHLYPDYANGDSIKIISVLNDTTFSLSADFSMVDSRYRENSEAVTLEQDMGYYTIKYRISPNNTRFNASGLPVHLTARQGSYSSVDSSFTVNLVNTIEEEISFPSRFTPGDSFRFNLKSEGTVRVEIYTMSSERVVSLESGSEATVFEIPWDCRNSDGHRVTNGVYLCKLTIAYRNGGGKTKIMPVAVLR